MTKRTIVCPHTGKTWLTEHRPAEPRPLVHYRCLTCNCAPSPVRKDAHNICGNPNVVVELESPHVPVVDPWEIPKDMKHL